MPSSNVFLVGMMGSGKSTVGRLLSQRLKGRFVDLDSEIQKKEKITISEIFETKGEPYFRELESEVLQGVLKKKGLVISTGGGIVLRSANVKAMRDSGIVIYLKTSVDVLLRRLKGSKDRPLLKTRSWREKVREIDKERRPFYEKAAHAEVGTNLKTPLRVAREIETFLEKYDEKH